MLYNGLFAVRAHLCNYFLHEAILLLNFLLVLRDASMMTCFCIYIYVFDESSLGGFTGGGFRFDLHGGACDTQIRITA